MTYTESALRQAEALRSKERVRILALETSCDETAASIVENGRTIVSNVVFSQIDLHALYGGVVPEIASRAHVEACDRVIDEALKEAGRILRKGGKLVFSDVCPGVRDLIGYCRAAGFAIRHMEDMTEPWKEYYLEALWKDENTCIPTGKGFSFVLFVCERV